MKLIFDQVTVSYQKKVIVRNANFSVMSGSITALIGRNGAGKSTLIRCLTGEKQDYLGTITLDGLDSRRMTPEERSRRLACLPQLLPRPHITVQELVEFGRAPYTPLTGWLSEEDHKHVNRAIHAVGLTSLADAFVDNLSGGERKKAFFAMTLAQDTPLIVLDEPTAHLDMVSRFEFLALLEKMRRETGKTFLLVMHELPEVLRCADQIIAISDKEIHFTGSALECIQENIPQKYFHIQISGDSSAGYAVRPL